MRQLDQTEPAHAVLSDTPGEDQPMIKALVVWIAAGAGVTLLILAIVEAVTSDAEQAVIALAVIGSVLLLSPLIIDRIEALEISGTKVSLKLSKAIAELGAPSTAAQLEDSGLTGLVESYEVIRQELSHDRFRPARIHLQDALVERAASLARTQKLDAREVRRIFAEGSPLLRVLTLGLMKGDQSLADGPTVLSAVANSRTANEQYHGLELAEAIWQRLSPTEQASVLAAAEADPRIAEDTDRRDALESLKKRASS